MFAVGMLFFLISFTAVSKVSPFLFFILSVVLGSVGALIFFFAQLKESPIPGVKKNNIMFLSMTNRGMLGWITAVFLTGMYILIYWFPELLENVNRIFDPLSYHSDRESG
jgi:ferredoxin-type protein NapH